MKSKENLVLYKQRVLKEIESLDPSLRDEYLEYEYKIYKDQYFLDHPESWSDMREFFQCDRRRNEKMKAAIEKPWSEVPLADKLMASFLGICLLTGIVLFLF